MNAPFTRRPQTPDYIPNIAQPTTLSDARHGYSVRAEERVVGLQPRLGEDSRLRPGERTSDPDSMTKDIL